MLNTKANFLRQDEIGIQHLTEVQLKTFSEHRPIDKAGSLDAWRASEAQMLQNKILKPFADTLNRTLDTAMWPEGFLHIPVAMLKKNPGRLPIDQRLICMLSVWHAAFNSIHYDQRGLVQWREK